MWAAGIGFSLQFLGWKRKCNLSSMFHFPLHYIPDTLFTFIKMYMLSFCPLSSSYWTSKMLLWCQGGTGTSRALLQTVVQITLIFSHLIPLQRIFLNYMWNKSQMTDNILCLAIFQKRTFPRSHLFTRLVHEEVVTSMSCIRNRNLEVSFSSIRKRLSNSWIPSIRRQTEVIIKNYLNLHFLFLHFRKSWLSRATFLLVRSSPVMLPSQ